MKRTRAMKFGSDVIIDLLKQHHIEYIAGNPGASYRGLHDSIVNYASNNPQFIMCCHEEISVAIAHGFAKASGKYMAVMIHANIGLQHASMAIFNAWCDRVPILLIGGIGPMDAAKRRPWIEWIHTSSHHDGIIRDYVKWCDQPYSLAATLESLNRACRILNTEPKAPVYVAIDCTIQEDEVNSEVDTSFLEQFPLPTPPYPDKESLTKISDDLLSANCPLIIADYFGRQNHSVSLLIELAEALNIPVIDRGGRFNFPNNHSLCLSGMSEDIYQHIDYVLCLDVQDVWGALGKFSQGQYDSYLKPKVPIVHITLADYLVSKWAADYQKLFPLDMILTADSTVALEELIILCKQKLAQRTSKNTERPILAKKIHQELRSQWKMMARSQSHIYPLLTSAVIHEIGDAIKAESWALVNGGSQEMDQWAKRLWNFCEPGCHMGGSGGAGLGYGIGAAIGAALALKDKGKLCINLQADGDFLFTPSALWTAAYYEIPLLIIMMNNRSYNNSKEHAIKIAEHRVRDASRADHGTAFAGQPVNFPQLARAFNIYALDTITLLEEIKPAITEAIHFIKTEKKPVLIDIVIQ